MMKIQSSKFKVFSKIFIVLMLCILNLTFVITAFAAEEGEAAHTSIFKDYMWKIINFGILAFILFKYGKKPFQSFLKQRAELIEKTLKEAKEAKEAAEKALLKVEERLKTKDKEIEEILSLTKRSGEVERENLMEQGDRLKEKILEQAKANIAYELKHAKEAIKAEAAEVAIELAEKKLKEKLTKEEQERLLDESITKIGGSN
jgi:F-type H+-transporting ATPase subunit b